MSPAERIAKALGAAKKTGKQWLCSCPVHDDRHASMTIDDTKDGNVVWYCFAGCDGRDIGGELHRRGLLPRSDEWRERPSRPTPIKSATDHSKLHYLLSKLQPIDGTVVETYLRSRDLDLPPDGHHLRFLPAKPPRFIWPCMVGIITAFADASRIMSLHFTRLRPDGLGKAPLPKHEQRSCLGGFPIKGGVIRLCHDADDTRRIGFGEGIETCLAVTTAFRRDEGRHEPVWAALNAGNLGELEVVDGIETIVVYADRGPAGEAGADQLAQRWLDADREVEVAIAPVDDFNPAAAS
jgi:putative DNA primase/helicase